MPTPPTRTRSRGHCSWPKLPGPAGQEGRRPLEIEAGAAGDRLPARKKLGPARPAGRGPPRGIRQRIPVRPRARQRRRDGLQGLHRRHRRQAPRLRLESAPPPASSAPSRSPTSLRGATPSVGSTLPYKPPTLIAVTNRLTRPKSCASTARAAPLTRRRCPRSSTSWVPAARRGPRLGYRPGSGSGAGACWRRRRARRFSRPPPPGTRGLPLRCFTLTAPEGTAIAHASPRGSIPAQQPPGPPGREEQRRDPGGTTTPQQATQLADLLRSFAVTFEARRQGYLRPPARRRPLRAESQAQATCSMPWRPDLHRARLQRQAVFSDGSVPRPRSPDGPTDQCNLNPKCRRHHRTKQAPGWKSAQCVLGHRHLDHPVPAASTPQPPPSTTLGTTYDTWADT